MELWTKDKDFLYLIPSTSSCWYYQHKPGDTTLWINGISLYWLIDNGYSRRY
jgi:hypothetical protein